MKKLVVLLMLVGMLALPAFAQERQESTESQGDADSDLAKKTQNPVADLISLPFQWNVFFDLGPDNRTGSVLNIQPVIPFNLNDDWNFITRTILPVVNQPPFGTLSRQEWELGNLQFSGFFSPLDTEGGIWGFGPVFEFPTHTGDVFASDNYSAGPTFVALKMTGPWVE